MKSKVKSDMGNILVLAPHTDDGEIGCGATISKLLEQEKSVYYVAFSIAEESVPEGYRKDVLATEVKKATKKLGIPKKNLKVFKFKVRKFPQYRQEILEEIILLKKAINPGLVFMPSSYDVHQDHKTIYEEGVRAFRNTSILGYEFMWNNYSFGSTYFSVVSRAHIDRKIAAINEYKSQNFRLYTQEKMVAGQANFRGLQIGEEYAEAFEVIRWIER